MIKLHDIFFSMCDIDSTAVFSLSLFLYLYPDLFVSFRWELLKTQALERRGTLEEALGRAKDFNDHWKELVDWLADAERRAYADWKPCALLETCQADITKHQVRGQRSSVEKPLQGRVFLVMSCSIQNMTRTICFCD